MREILFRGIDKSTCKWVYGAYCHYDDVIDSGKDDCDYIIEKHNGEIFPFAKVIPETVGQYTGLTDKNGTKIFEGDIIKSDNGKSKAISIIKYGEFKPKLFYDLLEEYIERPKASIIGLFAETTKGEQCLLTNASNLIEVIGNIYDNPELLEVENE